MIVIIIFLVVVFLIMIMATGGITIPSNPQFKIEKHSENKYFVKYGGQYIGSKWPRNIYSLGDDEAYATNCDSEEIAIAIIKDFKRCNLRENVEEIDVFFKEKVDEL